MSQSSSLTQMVLQVQNQHLSLSGPDRSGPDLLIKEKRKNFIFLNNILLYTFNFHYFIVTKCC